MCPIVSDRTSALSLRGRNSACTVQDLETEADTMSTTWMTADEEDILLSVYGVSAEQAAFALQQPCDDPLPPSPAPAEMQGILQDLFSAFGIKDPGFLDGSANRSNQRHMQGLPNKSAVLSNTVRENTGGGAHHQSFFDRQSPRVRDCQQHAGLSKIVE
mmetsp:Transcript_16403/g.29250  ORF Transcript_16403/g.29250 Transcript_16403/m.29250 type:complete len:159 (-) Transcript_16403:1503-1979(-)